MNGGLIYILALYTIFIPKCHLIQTEYQTNVLNGTYFTNMSVSVHSEKEAIIIFPKSTSVYPYTIFVWTETTNVQYPVQVMVRQKKEATSWEVPLIVQTKSGNLKFYNTSRTLCHNNMDVISRTPRSTMGIGTPVEKKLIVSISTASETPIPVALRVEEQENFFLEESVEYSVTISPSEPRFFYYKYPDRQAQNFSSSIVLDIESHDNVCLTVSIQNASCPVFDLNQDITFKGQYQTIDTRGGVIIKRTEYPSGFFIVFVAKGDNYDCSQEMSLLPEDDDTNLVERRNMSSIVTFKMKPTIFKEAYIQASVTVVAATLIFYLIILSLSWFLLNYKLKCFGEEWGLKSRSFKKRNTGDSTDEIQDAGCGDNPVVQETIAELDGIRICGPGDTIEQLQMKTKLILCDLAKRDPEYIHRRSYNYLWHVLSIAIFYGIPVVQLVITYQRMLHVTGNQDLCYYNFLCAHPFMGFSDFNHIFSNIGYIVAGIAFLIIVVYRHKFYNRSSYEKRYIKYQLPTGIPQHFGLYYAMSVALVMEGVLSACYHVCPNQSNFQFDTSFMYVMVTLCLIKLYQNRHPDINATAYATFTVLGMAIFACMIGIVTGHIAIWIIFIVFYIGLCLYISLKIYFVKHPIIGLKIVNKKRKSDGILTLKPNKTDLFVNLTIFNVVNIFMAIGLSFVLRTAFPTYLLALLIGNALLYTIMYMIMKLRNGEQLYLRPIIFGLLSVVTWIVAIYFFKLNCTSWKRTAAQSRRLNQECVLLGYYDYHDIWHLLSAPALFFTFMLLLSLDDDLVCKPRNKIVVF